MNTKTKQTYDQVFQHPMTHNLEWRDVRALFETLGEVEEQHNGNLKVTLSGQAVVFHSPSDTDIATAEQLSQIRKLLKGGKSGHSDEAGEHLLLVIDHHEARIFRTEMKGAVPELVAPYDVDGLKGRIHTTHVQPGQDGQTNYDAYFADVAKNLGEPEKLLIFGSGTGTSSAMDGFVDWLAKHHHPLAEHVVGTVTVDQSHLTEGQLLAKAREIYSQ